MADDKNAREKQAADAEQRQRERELEEARERADEPEPPRDDPDRSLGALDEALDLHDYPASTDELIEAYGDREVESQRGRRSVADVLGSNDDETYDSADEVRRRIRGQLNR